MVSGIGKAAVKRVKKRTTGGVKNPRETMAEKITRMKKRISDKAKDAGMTFSEYVNKNHKLPHVEAYYMLDTKAVKPPAMRKAEAERRAKKYKKRLRPPTKYGDYTPMGKMKPAAKKRGGVVKGKK